MSALSLVKGALLYWGKVRVLIKKIRGFAKKKHSRVHLLRKSVRASDPGTKVRPKLTHSFCIDCSVTLQNVCAGA